MKILRRIDWRIGTLAKRKRLTRGVGAFLDWLETVQRNAIDALLVAGDL